MNLQFLFHGALRSSNREAFTVYQLPSLERGLAMPKVKVAIVGAGGYGGCGAIELLLRHPNAEIVALIEKQDV